MNMSFFLFSSFPFCCVGGDIDGGNTLGHHGRRRRRNFVVLAHTTHTHWHDTWLFLFCFLFKRRRWRRRISVLIWWEQRGGGVGGVPDLEEMRESETRRRKATLLGVVLGLRRWHGCAHGDGGVSFWGMETCRWRWGKEDKGFVIMSLRR